MQSFHGFGLIFQAHKHISFVQRPHFDIFELGIFFCHRLLLYILSLRIFNYNFLFGKHIVKNLHYVIIDITYKDIKGRVYEHRHNTYGRHDRHRSQKPSGAGQFIDFQELLKGSRHNFKIHNPFTIHSENLIPDHWQALYRKINSIEDTDGIIITHGTDTLVYTAAFCL